MVRRGILWKFDISSSLKRAQAAVSLFTIERTGRGPLGLLSAWRSSSSARRRVNSAVLSQLIWIVTSCWVIGLSVWVKFATPALRIAKSIVRAEDLSLSTKAMMLL